MHLCRLAILCALIGGLEIVNAEGSPLVKSDRLGAASAAPFTFVQDYKPDWMYGPKWGGFGSAYRDRYGFGSSYRGRYGYRSYSPGDYGYSPRYRYRAPGTRAR